MPDKELSEKLDAFVKITKLFQLERMVYVIATCAALLMLLVNGFILIINGNAGAAELSLLFGSGGLITVSLNRILRMWNVAMGLITGIKAEEEVKP
jgi:hypothetical protein